MKNILLFLLFFLFLLPVSNASDYEQNFVGGFGIGGSSYGDENGFGVSNYEKLDGISGTEFFEYYPYSNLGIGLHTFSVAYMRKKHDEISQDDGKTNQYEQLITVRGILLTLNAILVGSESWARIGILAGYGIGSYEYLIKAEKQETYDDGYYTYTYTNRAESEKTGNGTSQMAGIYIDGGGDIFGMRIGYDYVKADFENFDIDEDYIQKNDIIMSGTGTIAYIAFRWAW